jgi:Asp-tRNA(Asn)/Glu-tRNA(Gln) amidotransferase A subunit family amidase
LTGRPERLTATEAARRLASGSLTAEALTRACLERIAARAEISAWASLDADHAVRQAKAADRAGRPGVLSGVPVGVKDIIDTADLATEHGSPIYRGNRPLADAACVALTRAAGGVILGKTVTTEFANRHPGPTANPHDPAHTPGGSSSGSAAAVADFQVPVAFGTQTAGSVIRPAAYCGAVGYKPTFGHFGPAGIKLQAHSLDTLGLITRSLDDLALMDAALLGGPVRALDRNTAAPRIAVCRAAPWGEPDEATQALIESTAARMAERGASVRALIIPQRFDAILEMHGRIMEFEAARSYAFEHDTRFADVSPALRDGALARGRALPVAAYVEALETAECFRRFLDDEFAETDVILAPSAHGEAPAGLEWTGDPRFNAVWTLAWTPCITLPAGRGPRGLPLGVQLVGRRGRDAALIDAAGWVEAGLPTRDSVNEGRP